MSTGMLSDGEMKRIADFDSASGKLFCSIPDHLLMVLSTSSEGRVSSRTMSVVVIGDRFLFQTDRRMLKCRQILSNPQVALCAGNLQVEGVCTMLGVPTESPAFAHAYKACFPGSYDHYSAFQDERVFEVVPSFIQRWVYEDDVPFIERFDMHGQRYVKEQYRLS